MWVASEKLKQTIKNHETLPFQNTIHHERSNIAVSFLEHLISSEKVFPDFYTCTLCT